MKPVMLCLLLLQSIVSYSWGFYAHKKINYLAVFLLPPEMLAFYKPNISFIEEHAVDPDKRRYAIAAEGPRHYIDIDHYGKYPFDSLPRIWPDAIAKYGIDTLQSHGIVPWWWQIMLTRLTYAFKEKDAVKILKYSAEIGHYIADAHVPLHTSSNHDGQHTGQKGIHGFWESRVPELLCEQEWDLFIGKAEPVLYPSKFIWSRILESAAASDSVLRLEKELNNQFPVDRKYAFELRNGILTRQYSTAYTIAYSKLLNGMVERRMRQSIYAVASFWYTAWINAGQPDLRSLSTVQFSDEDLKEFEQLNDAWRKGNSVIRPHE
ncbi:MAG TPA: zinc dependent phospholipase C family protein [Chitinophagaceae bacterium]|jgi:hypothetical protein|nr:zinc dependent phospholipase C family protein [Chitinophagaceae bacterium]